MSDESGPCPACDGCPVCAGEVICCINCTGDTADPNDESVCECRGHICGPSPDDIAPVLPDEVCGEADRS